MANLFVGLPKDADGKRTKTYLYAGPQEEGQGGDVGRLLGGRRGSARRLAPGDPGKSGQNPRTLFIPKRHTTETRPLEIIFLDVGQGGGAVLITPERDADERVIVIDAGVGGHMPLS